MYVCMVVACLQPFTHVFAQTGKYCAGLPHILLRLFRSLSAFFLLTLTSYVANQFGSLDHHRSRLGGKKSKRPKGCGRHQRSGSQIHIQYLIQWNTVFVTY